MARKFLVVLFCTQKHSLSPEMKKSDELIKVLFIRAPIS
jgi:hypothetical protein